MTCKYKIIIPFIIHSYILRWYHKYLLHTGMDRTDAVIFQHFYWPGIGKSFRKEVNNCDTCQRKKWSNIKYGKLPTREAE